MIAVFYERKIMTSPNFICPICQSPLIVGEKIWQCTGDNPQARQHSFDLAKQGYINLLPVQQKNAKNPGDSDLSIQARQRFLQAGFYEPLRHAVINMAQTMNSNTVDTWLDIGCGEGFYTQGFLTLNPRCLIALDISKPAVIATAKALKSVHLSANTFSLVASASQVPLADKSVNVISTLFSPILPQEFYRLMAADGILLIAKPAQGHLLQLRQGLFDTVLPHDSDKFIAKLSPFFSLQHAQKVCYEIAVTVDDMADLLTMTPYSYRAKAEKRQALLDIVLAQGKMALTIEFMVYGFTKRADDTLD